jgi:hypothetical protein
MGDSAVSFTPAIPRMRERTGNAFSPCAATGRLSRLSCVVAMWDAWDGYTHSAGEPLKTGLLGRLGRLFQTHSGTEVTHAENKDLMSEKLNDFEPGVPGVLSVLAIEPHRPLSERKCVILAKVEAENDPLILEALRMFNATVASIEPSDNFRRANFTPHRCNR